MADCHIIKCYMIKLVIRLGSWFSMYYNGVALNAEKVRYIKRRLLDQAMILFNCVSFQIGTSLKGNNLLPEEANFFLYDQFITIWKITFIKLSDLP